MRNAAVALAVGLLLVLSACHSYQASAAPTPQAAVGFNQKIRLTMTDGSLIELRNASARGDSIAGADIVTGEVRVVAADRVQKVETEGLNAGRTTALALGATAVTGAVLYGAFALLWWSAFLSH